MKNIKQWHRVAVVAVFLSLMCSVTVGAFDFSVNNIYYNINDKTLTAEVTYGNSYNSYSGQIVIPATVSNNGKVYDVTAVGENAFRDCSGLTSVTFGSNVATIGKRAFLNCSALASVNITNGITEIRDYAFAQCGTLSTVTMNNDSPLHIGNGAFMRCSSLNNVKWQSCENLEGRGGITTLGTSAFAYCTSLTSIMLPGDIQLMGTSIFDGCTSLASITVTAEQPLAVSGDPFSLNSSVTIYVPSSGQVGVTAALYQNAMGWRNYNITELPYSFIDNNGYTYLKTSSSTVALSGMLTQSTVVNVIDGFKGYSGENYYVTSIIDQLFKGSGITTLNTSNAFHLEHIGTECFAGCTKLTTIILNEGISSLGERVFANCSKLTSVQIPSTLRTISKGTFENCSKLTNVNLLRGVATICENAFANCTSLITFFLPSSTACIEYNAFKGTSALTEIIVDPICPFFTSLEGVLYEMKYGIGFDLEEANEFSKLAVYPSNKADEMLYIPPGVTEIKAAAIQNATHLKKVAIPPTTTIFGEDCFDGTNIQLINYRCNNPTSDGTLGITSALKANATLQVPVGTMSKYQALEAWQGFSNIVERYDVYSDNKFVYDWNSSNQVTLLDIKPAAVNASGTVTLPLGMTLNGRLYVITELKNTSTAQVAQQVKNLTMGCDSLAIIDLSDDTNPFAALTSLEAISIGESNSHFKIIDNVLYNKRGNLVYYYLHSKEQDSFSLPSEVDTIMPQAFAQNHNLKILTSNLNLRHISNKSFEGCTSLHTVDSMKNVTSIGFRAFAGCTALTTINGGERLSSIDKYAFHNCKKLRQFPFIHGLITTIGSHAFRGCSSLEVVVLSNKLSSIGNGAFENCTSLSKAFLTNDIKNLGNQVFKGCTSLSELWLYNTTPPQVGSDFFDPSANITLFVPEEATSAYHTTAPWSNASQINTCHYLYNGADVNNDRAINAYDITYLYSVLLGDIDIDITEHCDVNRDGAITAADISMIYDYILTGTNSSMPYSFIDSNYDGVSPYISLAAGTQRIWVLSHYTNNFVTSGVLGISDNTHVANVILGTSQGAQHLDLVPVSQGYFTFVAIVNNGTTYYYGAFPIIVK